MLTWKNDPLLLDSRVTAKDLIEQGKEQLLLDKNTGVLNLFSALVKKEDLVRTSDIYYNFLKRTPFVSIDPEIIETVIVALR